MRGLIGKARGAFYGRTPVSKDTARRRVATGALLALVAFAAFHGAADASTSDTTFNAISTQVTNYVQGGLGKVVMISAVIAGIGMGIVRQSLMPFVIGVGGGIGLYNTPTILSTIFAAALPGVQSMAANVDLVHAAALLNLAT